MTEAKAIAEAPVTGGPSSRSARSMFSRLEVDFRLLGMIAALAILWIAFNFLSDGLFLSPRNLWNLSVQSAAVAIMTTGMVLVIVSRNIDLSIGSILVFVAMIMGLLQTEWIPKVLGSGFDQSYIWIVVVLVGIAVGALIGGVHGFLVAFIGIPSFIVTLGGLLIWRGAAFQLARGRTIAPLDSTFQLLGGGPRGSLGETLSWLVAGLAILAIIYGILAGRRRRRRYGFPLRPVWADVTLGVIGSLAVAGAVWVANSYPWPPGAGGAVRGRARDPDPARWPPDPDRDRHPGPHRHRHRRGHDGPRDTTPIRALRVRDRRQPGGRGAGRHQHPADDHEDLHRDGHARRHRGGRDLGAVECSHARLGDWASSSRSSRRRSSVARRSPAASARSPVACSARSSCSRSRRAWS